MRLKNLKMYKRDEVPDHIVEEVDQFLQSMFEKISPLLNQVPPNIALAALNLFHAACIKSLISNEFEALRSASATESMTLIKNIEFLSGFKFLEDDEDER